jgi:hypothetical protein
MSSLRRLEREVIRSKCYKQKGSVSGFTNEWNTYRTTKFGDTLPVDTTPKKKHFYDKKDTLINALRYQKMKIQEYMASLKKEKEKVEETIVTE